MRKITTVLSAAMVSVAFSSAAIADGHAAGEEGMHHGSMNMPPECEVAVTMIEEAGLDPMEMGQMMMKAGPEGDPVAGLADAMDGDMGAAEQLMADLEATGTSPEDCGMMPPGMGHGTGPEGMDYDPASMGPEGMDHGGMGPEGMDHSGMGPEGTDHGGMGPEGMGPDGMQ